MILIKICGMLFIGLCGVYILKLIKPEYALLVAVITTVISATIIFEETFFEIFTKIKILSAEASVGKYIGILFKALGIGYLTVITSGICKKAGEEMFSNIVESAGKFEILALCVPMASELIEIAKDLL